ncbi:5-dehydro-4-deoxyglucarate dehydratase [Salibacterium aidingense]|uniref:5-dehydro-4-deoxyglucarate dehydratase n=1 Tax=Salibacterium aidingense TaxID=384933 RepID=UPI003BDF458A
MSQDGSRSFPKGILGFPVTPFKESGEVDQNALEQNINFLVKEDVSALFIGCGSGEFQSLGEKEYRQLIEAAVHGSKNKVPVYTGVGGNIKEAVKQAEVSEELGADGYLMLPPYLIQGEQEGLYHYFETVINSTDLNAVVYQRNNAVLDVDTVERLTAFPQLIGMKDGLGNMELNVEITQTLGSRLEWMNGMPFAEVTMPAYYKLGFETYSSAISNYIPHISRIFFEALKKEQHDKVQQLYQDVILPINHIRKKRKGYAVSLIKAGMEIMGMPVGQAVRPPLVPVEKEHYTELENVLKTAMEKYPLKNKQEG